MFDTKVAVVVRDDLAGWQALNVTAFLSGGIAAAHPEVIGEPYQDASGRRYARLPGQPIVVLVADTETLKAIHRRGLERDVPLAIYTHGMFATGHDAANRAEVARHATEALDLVGVALRAEKKTVDKVTKGAKLHP